MLLRIGITDSLLFNLINETNDKKSHELTQAYTPNKGVHLLAPFIKLNTVCQLPPVEIIIFSTLPNHHHQLFYQSLNQHGLGRSTTVMTASQTLLFEIEQKKLHLFLSDDQSLNTFAQSIGTLSAMPNLNTTYGKLKVLFDCPFFSEPNQSLMPFLKILGYLQKSASVSCEVSVWVNERHHLNQQIRELFYLADCHIDSVIYDCQCEAVDVLYFYKPHLTFLTEGELECLSPVVTFEDKNFTF